MICLFLESLQRRAREVKPYRDILDIQEKLEISIQLTDSGEEGVIELGEEIKIKRDGVKPDARLTLTSDVYEKIQSGEADFGALIGRSRMSDVRPINIEIFNKKKIHATNEAIKFLLTIFFVPGKMKIRILDEKLAGEAHGAHPIPLVYWKGLRYAWYYIGSGELLNIDWSDI
jgi:hypothetical protein